MFILLVTLIFSGGYQMQSKFDYCKKIEFKGKYCEVQKKLNEVKK